jgi:tetratricopeptide (TPR) repeat protein
MLALETGTGAVLLLDPETGREYARLEDPNQDPASMLQFSPDGSRLVVTSQQGQALHVWDLLAIRRQLAALDLDWDLPPYTPAVEHGAVSPIEVAVDTTEVEVASLDPHALHGQLTLYSLAAALCPINPQAYLERGRIHSMLEQWREAAEDFSRCLLFVQSARAYAFRAAAHWELHQPAKALADLDLALAIDPNIPATAAGYNNFAWFYATAPASMRRPDKALPLAQKAAELEGSWVILNTLGVVYYRVNRFEDAKQALEKGIQKNAGHGTAFDWYFLAMVHARQGAPVKARECLDQAERWRKQPTIPLTPDQVQELNDFRTEAKAILSP